MVWNEIVGDLGGSVTDKGFISVANFIVISSPGHFLREGAYWTMQELSLWTRSWRFTFNMIRQTRARGRIAI